MMSNKSPEVPQTAWKGKYLSLLVQGTWEYVSRIPGRPGVGIVAVTEDRRLVLVQQHRIPVGRPVIELPAGLVGDLPGSEEEPLLEAAQRELWEETGYRASQWRELDRLYASPGLTDESLVLFLAQGLQRVGPGGGDGQESIVVHELALEDVLSWLRRNDYAADLKVLAGLHLASQFLR